MPGVWVSHLGRFDLARLALSIYPVISLKRAPEKPARALLVQEAFPSSSISLGMKSCSKHMVIVR